MRSVTRGSLKRAQLFTFVGDFKGPFKVPFTVFPLLDKEVKG